MKTDPNHFAFCLPPLIEQRKNETTEELIQRIEETQRAVQQAPPLTKREYFAAMAMQALINSDYGGDALPEVAVEYANQLIIDLNR